MISKFQDGNAIITHLSKIYGGESEIRTHEEDFPLTRFRGVLLQPLGHLSKLHQ